MAYKAFAENEIQPRPFVEEQTISISEDSPCASHLHLLTGVRSLGKLNVFKSGTNPTFNETDSKEIKYSWNFDNQVLVGQALTANITTGVFLSSSDQTYRSSTNPNSKLSSQDLFRYAQGYLYRADNDYNSTTALVSSSSADTKVSVLREINIRKDIYHSSLKSAAFKMQINDSNTSLTAAIDGASANAKYNTIAAGIFGSETPNVSGYTTALDLKNPFGGEEGTGRKSFFGVSVTGDGTNGVADGTIFHTRNGLGYTAGDNLDSIREACTIETIIRPMKSDSVLYFRRLASSQDTLTKNKFMKMELTRSADNREPAFRFYIRDADTGASFSEDFAQPNVQASGLFVPADVGIDMYDGDFHHIVVSWDINEIGDPGNNASADRGAGVVMGYIDGYKLPNKEQVFPRLMGSDAAGGPTIQANMIDQRIPIKQTALYTAGIVNAPTGNNVYIGASNFNRNDGVRTGDWGALADQYDSQLEGLYDGQVAHVRVWNQRLLDGTTGFKDGVGKLINLDPTDAQSNGANPLGLSFTNFKNTALTGTSSASNIAAWWYFNNMNGITGADISGGMVDGSAVLGNISSNTGSVVGNGIVKLLDSKDITNGVSGNTITDLQVSGIPRDFLYFDQPQLNNPVDSKNTQGRLIRKTIQDSIKRIGLVFYDLGLVTIDGDDPNARLDFTFPASGATGDFGFAVTGHNNTAFNFQRVVYNSQVDRGRLLVDAVASGSEMNFSGNPSGVNPETGGSIFDEPATYITSVGLYNHTNDLLAIAKLSKPVRKDEALTLGGQVKLDF